MKMRFLVIQTPKEDVPGKWPAKEMLSKIVDHLNYYRELKEKGTVVAAGAFAGQRGGFGVFKVGSLEELNELVNYAPGTPYMNTEIYPLVDTDTRIAQLKEQKEKFSEKSKVAVT
jgi:muconolactone delta-isomerase